MADDWSLMEVEATVATYLEMLEMELAGIAFNKAERERALLATLPRRTMGAVRYKLGNLSAALVDLGKPYVDGYKPYGNYQRLVAEVADEQINAHPTLLALIEASVVRPAIEPEMNFDAILTDPPKREKPARTYERPSEPRITRGKNYLEMEARNRSLGRAGEDFVLAFERNRLWAAGEERLADRIEHVAVTKGDGLGYDIHSFEESGKDRLIEVKTTRFGSLTPFYLSVNEVHTSEANEGVYHLYRLFRFETPRLFVVSGSLKQHFQLEPDRFRAKIA